MLSKTGEWFNCYVAAPLCGPAIVYELHAADCPAFSLSFSLRERHALFKFTFVSIVGKLIRKYCSYVLRFGLLSCNSEFTYRCTHNVSDCTISNSVRLQLKARTVYYKAAPETILLRGSSTGSSI